MEDVPFGFLAEAWQGGDETAFDRLVQAMESRLMSYLLRIAESREEAEDLFQETWLRVHGARDRVPAGEGFPFYLFRIARNLAVSARRRRKVEDRDLEERAAAACEETETAGTEATAEGEETLAAVRGAMERLSKPQQEIVALRVWAGLNFREIGELLGFSPDTAARRFAETIRLLSAELGPFVGE